MKPGRMRRPEEDARRERLRRYCLCPMCDQPMRRAGTETRSGEYDHATGCPYAGLDAGEVANAERLAREERK